MLEKIKNIIAAQLGVDAEQITEETDIEADLGADSLDAAEMLAVFEEECGIYIPDDDAVVMRTVSDILAYIN